GVETSIPKKEVVALSLFLEEIPAVQPIGTPGYGAKSRATRAIGISDTADYVTARLKRDDPALAEKVVRGEITPNAAARRLLRCVTVCRVAGVWGCGGVWVCPGCGG